MNRYPLWKNLLIGLVLLWGLIYTLPNFYGEVPAVQVSSGKATLKLDPGAVSERMAGALKEAGIEHEGIFADLKDGPLAHLPSGKYAANAAWVALAVIAFNIARAAAVAAGLAKARWATLRRQIIQVPARIAATGRRLVLHLPTHWPWAHAWRALHARATSPPQPVTP